MYKTKLQFWTNLIVVATVAYSSSSLAMADWPTFRGPNASSIAAKANIPTEFSAEGSKNIAWKVPMPGRGVGGAIVVDGQVITTSSSGIDQRRIFVTSVSEKDGKVLWQQQLVARGRPYCHPSSANAAPTPVTDGKRVFAFYSSNDLACLDLQGNLLWYRALAVDYPKAGNDVGMSSSPVVADGVVLVQIECQGDSFAAGLDAETGETLWRISRPTQANWASPLAAKTADGKSLFILQCGKSLEAYQPTSGKQLWATEMACSSIPSTSYDGNQLFVPSKGLTLLELGSQDQPPKQAWNNNKLGANSASPIVYKGSVYTVNRTVLVKGDALTGELKWQLRLPEAGSIWSTPVLAGKHMFVFTEDGRCFVVDLEEEGGKIVATNALGENVLGSPAISGDSMFVRSTDTLWKISRN